MTKGQKPTGIEKTVDWCAPKKGVIKFMDEDEAFEIAENVQEAYNFEKYPIFKGDTVTIGVTDDKVTFLRKTGSANKGKKSEKTQTEEAKTETVVKIVTVEARRKDFGAIKVKEDGTWPKVSDSLQQKMDEVGLIAGNRLEIKIEGDTIIAVKKLDDVKEESKSENDTNKDESKKATRSGSYRDEDAVDVRTANMSAKDIIVAMINAHREEVNTSDKVENMILSLTTACLNAIRKNQ